MAPKDDRAQRKKSTDDDAVEGGILLTAMEAQADKRVLKLLRKALYPQPLLDKLNEISTGIENLTAQLLTKDTVIAELQKKVYVLEESADAAEQYTRRSNLVFHGFGEINGGNEDTDAKIIALINDEMDIVTPLQIGDIARSHRLGTTRRTQQTNHRTLHVGQSQRLCLPGPRQPETLQQTASRLGRVHQRRPDGTTGQDGVRLSATEEREAYHGHVDATEKSQSRTLTTR